MQSLSLKKYLTQIIVLLCPLALRYNWKSDNLYISKLLSFLATRYSSLSLNDVNTSNASFKPTLLLLFVIVNLYFKLGEWNLCAFFILYSRFGLFCWLSKISLKLLISSIILFELSISSTRILIIFNFSFSISSSKVKSLFIIISSYIKLTSSIFFQLFLNIF